MTRVGLSAPLSFVLALSALAVCTVACGAKGSDDDDTTGGSSNTTGGTGGSSSATGGSGGSANSTGGTGGSAGSPATVTQKWSFDMDQQDWTCQYTSSGTEADGTTAIPIFAPGDVKVNWVSDKGDGDGMGALAAEIPYTSARQYAGIGIHLNGADLTAKKLTARVKIDMGLESSSDLSSYSPGAKLYLKSGPMYTYSAGNYVSITASGTWYTLKFDLSDPNSWSYVDTANGTFDPTEIGELGVQIDTPDALESMPVAATVLIDNVQY